MCSSRPVWWREPFMQCPTGTARQLVVVTDIDGRFVEQRTRSPRDEWAALDFLASRGIPVVINSSRTRAEIERLHQTLRMLTPFISEHGSALFVPHGCFPFVPQHARPAVGGAVIEFGRRYHEVVDLLRAASREAGVETIGFAELTIEDVARALGVPIVEAQLAKLREYTEVFRLVRENDAARNRLIKALRRRGLRCCRIASHQLVSAAHDCAESLRTLKRLWRHAWGDPFIVGVADSEDDLPWLRQADVSVFVRQYGQGVPPRALSKLRTLRVTRAPGRAGWSEAIFEVVGTLLQAPRRGAPRVP